MDSTCSCNNLHKPVVTQVFLTQLAAVVCISIHNCNYKYKLTNLQDTIFRGLNALETILAHDEQSSGYHAGHKFVFVFEGLTGHDAKKMQSWRNAGKDAEE